MDVLADLRQGIEGQRRGKWGKQLERTTPVCRTGALGSSAPAGLLVFSAGSGKTAGYQPPHFLFTVPVQALIAPKFHKFIEGFPYRHGAMING